MKRDEAVQLTVTALNDLNQALAEGRSEVLQTWLKVVARFHRYSFRNALLIAKQRPEATRVAGFRRWPSFGRHVRKGEKGIAIFAPMVNHKRQTEDEENAANLRGFRVVHVFDVSQTDGETLPEFSQVSGEPGESLCRLEQLVRESGIELEYVESLGGANGASAGGRIYILQQLAPADRFHVLAHELAHERIHRNVDGTVSRSRIETEAEAVAYVVSQAVGITTIAHSADYIHLYHGDVQMLSDSLHTIQRTAAEIVLALDSTEPAELEPLQAVASI